MKYVVNPPGCWEFQLISDRAKYFCDSEGAFLFWLHLFVIDGLQVRESSHTWLPFFNGVNNDFCLSAMRLLASSCAANASSQFCCSVFILSSMVGYFVVSNASGTAIGDSPNINLNGVCVLSACL